MTKIDDIIKISSITIHKTKMAFKKNYTHVKNTYTKVRNVTGSEYVTEIIHINKIRCINLFTKLD